jgi:uncharacterized protein
VIEMDCEERINKDIELFAKNIKEIKSIKFDGREKEVIVRAKSYCRDTEYYLEKQDCLTAFGCINYAHGLLDALRLFHNII